MSRLKLIKLDSWEQPLSQGFIMETEPISFCYPFKGENIERVFTVLSNQRFVSKEE